MTDVLASVADLIRDNWNGAASLSAAIDTTELGYTGTKETFIVVDTFEDVEIVIPQMVVTKLNEDSMSVQNGVWERHLVRIYVYVPRNWGGVGTDPGTLMGYLNEMIVEIKRIIRANTGKDGFGVTDNINIIDQPFLKPNWICREVMVEIDYVA